jgi:hypothetical protein
MVNLLIAIAVVFGGYWLIRKFASASPAQVRGMLKKSAGAGLIALAGLLALRGLIDPAIAVFVLGLGFLGKQFAFPDGFKWGRKSTGQASRVQTSVLSMELDHDSGRMDGDVLKGPLAGRRLSDLAVADLKSLYKTCAAAGDQSLALLEAWLDRALPAWRREWDKQTKSARPSSGAAMSRAEALAVLGLGEGASASQIRAAHRRLMKDFHPDKGGSDYLAAKINQAKDILLQD